MLARHTDWPQPFKFLKFPDPGLTLSVVKENDEELVFSVKVDRPLKSLFFSVVDADERDWEWSDNNLDVVPRDPQTVVVRGLGRRRIQYAYLGSERAKIWKR